MCTGFLSNYRVFWFVWHGMFDQQNNVLFDCLYLFLSEKLYLFPISSKVVKNLCVHRFTFESKTETKSQVFVFLPIPYRFKLILCSEIFRATSFKLKVSI